MILTVADTTERTISNAITIETERLRQKQESNNNNNNNKRPAAAAVAETDDCDTTTQQQHQQGVQVCGPDGTQAFLNSLRHFMRRDKFTVHVKEGAYRQTEISNNKPVKKQSKRAKKQKAGSATTAPLEGFLLQTLAFNHDDTNNNDKQACSFIFRTPPILGSFLPEKAKELQIPKGPLYGQLKNGKSVTFTTTTEDGVDQTHTVHSHQVVAKGSPGVAVVVVYCPTRYVLKQLESCPEINGMKSSSSPVNEKDTKPALDVIVHMTPKSIFESEPYTQWRKTFGNDAVDHIWMDTYETISPSKQRQLLQHPSPFLAAALGGHRRSLVNSQIYPSPLLLRTNNNASPPTVDNNNRDGNSSTTATTSNDGFTTATTSLEYVLIPRARKGIRKAEYVSETDLAKETELAKKEVDESGALLAAAKQTTAVAVPDEHEPEIIFTGTGSAIPCKHRNVTGIYVKMKMDNNDNNNRAMLLDCGEGTVGQLLRSGKSIESIQAVWVSHPHADHHLGLLRLLTEIPADNKPILLISPPNLFHFLEEYEQSVDNSIKGKYIKVNCYETMPGQYRLSKHIEEELNTRLGITRIQSIAVSHCRHSFALVIDCHSFGRIAYSGDCRPSRRFAEAAQGASVLIHEATFENGMEEEAVVKKHSTVGEALSIGQQAEAKTVVLTHFSQRYPRIAPLDSAGVAEKFGFPIVFAFDFMRLTPSTIQTASQLTPAMRLLYPDDSEGTTGAAAESGDGRKAKELLSIPGAFANKDLMGHI